MRDGVEGEARSKAELRSRVTDRVVAALRDPVPLGTVVGRYSGSVQAAALGMMR